MEAQCLLAEQLYDCVQLHALQWVQLISALFSVVLCVYTAKKYVHKSLFESSAKDLIIAAYFFCALYSLAIGISQSFHLIARYTASVPCHSQISKKLCIFRFSATSIAPSLVIIHIGITTQRFQSTFLFRFQKFTSRLFIFGAGLYSCIYGFFAFRNETMDGYSPYCISNTKSTEMLLLINLCAMLASDILSATATFGLWWYNDVMLKKHRKEYNLKKTFHRKQCILAIKQFLPVTVLHTLTYIVSFFATRTSSSLKDYLTPAQFIFFHSAINVIPYYCVLAPLILLILIRRGKFERNNFVRGFIAPERREINTEKYFNQLNSLWTPVTRKFSKYSVPN